MVLAMNWQMIGYMMVIYIAAIQNISEEIKEAALIDGVTRGQMIRKIILPLIMPAITICLFMTTTNAFKMFDLNLALTAGLRENRLLWLHWISIIHSTTEWVMRESDRPKQ